MKKIIAFMLSLMMIFSICSVAVSAEEEAYEIVFTEFPYDVAPFRDDYVGKYMGYEYGVDYWFTLTNSDGTTTEIKGYPYSITVEAGDALEFTVNISESIEPSSVKVMAFPTGADKQDDFSDSVTGEPNGGYYISRSNSGTYGIVPKKDMTICLSEYHLYNKAFIYEFPASDYYVANRVFLKNPDAVNPQDRFGYDEMGNTKVVFVDETMFFEVRIPLEGKYDYNYDTYHVYYKYGRIGESQTVYLKKPASEKDGTPEINERVARYEDEETNELVDVYKIEHVPADVEIKVANVVQYTIEMLAQFLADFDLANLSEMDLSTVDLAPMVEYILRLLNLVVKLLNSFGLNISLPDLVG